MQYPRLPWGRGFFFWGEVRIQVSTRVCVFIDGFNLYHAIVETYAHQRFKWLDLRQLSRNFIEPGETLADVLYFTAYPCWVQAKTERHKVYVSALNTVGVKCVLGRYKKVTRQFVADKMTVDQKQTLPIGYNHTNLPGRIRFHTHEEKETDVNIALYLYDYAVHDKFDKALLVSADSDLAPAISLTHHRHPSKIIECVLPVNKSSKCLSAITVRTHRIETQHLECSLLPDPVITKRGKEIFKPTVWA